MLRRFYAQLEITTLDRQSLDTIRNFLYRGESLLLQYLLDGGYDPSTSTKDDIPRRDWIEPFDSIGIVPKVRILGCWDYLTGLDLVRFDCSALPFTWDGTYREGAD